MKSLNIRGWFQNKKWSSKLQKISLNKLITMIQYKAQWYGRRFIQINPSYPSTRTCHNCGHIREQLPLKIREWTCPQCGKHHQRDINDAINIKKRRIKKNIQTKNTNKNINKNNL